jgi:hypothetical protein
MIRRLNARMNESQEPIAARSAQLVQVAAGPWTSQHTSRCPPSTREVLSTDLA